MARRKLRQTVVRGRRLVAGCASSSYGDDGPSQVAVDRRTWTTARRRLRQIVVRRKPGTLQDNGQADEDRCRGGPMWPPWAGVCSCRIRGSLFLHRTILERELNPLSTSPLPRHPLWIERLEE